MQNAPSVAYPVGRFSWQSRAALLALAGLGGFSVLSLAFVWPAEWGHALVSLLGAGWVLWLWIVWRCADMRLAGTLRWDAQVMGQDWEPGAGSWSWQEERAAQAIPVRHLERRLDWGDGMLVSGCIKGGTRWFWLSATSARERWGECRRAIEAKANPG